MSKSIKVDDFVHQELAIMKRGDEDFGDVIVRLLRIAELLVKVEPFLETERMRLERRLEELHAEKTPQ